MAPPPYRPGGNPRAEWLILCFAVALRRIGVADAALVLDPPPPAPETVVSIVSQSLRAGRYRREEAIYPTTGELVISLTDDMGEVRLVGIDLAMSEVTTRTFRIQPDGTGAMVETETSCRFRRGDWLAETTVRGRVAAEGSSLTCDHAIDAREAGRVVFDRRWTSRKNG